MQGTQTGSGIRGIGRYTLSITKAIIKKSNGRHEIIIVLNGLFPDTIEPLKKEFKTLLSEDSIKIWYAPCPVNYMDAENDFRRKAAELMREAFFESLKPDIIWIPSLFEGSYDNAVTSIGAFDKRTPVAVTVHDLIPMMFQDFYLNHNPRLKGHYFEKIKFLKKASYWLAVSEYTAKEAVRMLEMDESRIAVTYEGFDPVFGKRNISIEEESAIKAKFGIKKDFLLHVGIVVDSRKNIDTLLKAFSMLPNELRSGLQLVLTGGNPDFVMSSVKAAAKDVGVEENKLIFTGYVSDENLMFLYNICDLFIFPSWCEGFGLPPLEAMACGAPVLVANATSLPEVVGNSDALFDPFSVDSISERINRVLTDENFRNELSFKGFEQAKKFSWEESAKITIKAFENIEKFENISKSSKNNKNEQENVTNNIVDDLINSIGSIIGSKDMDYELLKELSLCIFKNFYEYKILS